MKVLIIGNGGKEHALALLMSFSNHVNKVFCAPGNPGISRLVECVPIATNDFVKIAEFAHHEDIDLILVNSNYLISLGIVNFLEARNLNVFAPKQDAAKLEWSKYFAKEFMLRRGIPSAPYAAFDKKEYAIAYARSRQLPIVIKADGLTDSRGVSIVNTYDGAIGAINACFDGYFGKESKYVIVENYLQGEELSLFLVCDGENYALLPSVKSYNRLYGQNRGPFTEGIGAISPHPDFSEKYKNQIEKEIIRPTLKGMKEEGRPYKGFLHLELLIDKTTEQVYVLEFNSCLGEPEAEAILPLLECDLFEVLWQAQKGNLGYYRGVLPSAETSKNAVAICTSLLTQGYPNTVQESLPIKFQVGLQVAAHSQLVDKSGEIDLNLARILLFHNGTKLDKNRNLTTSGGKIFGLTVLATDYHTAKQVSDIIIHKIDFSGVNFRKDIGVLS